MADPREPEFARPKFVNAVRTANRRRQADRPEEPKDMNFLLKFSKITEK